MTTPDLVVLDMAGTTVSDDGVVEHLRLVQLGDISLGHFFLFVVGIENRRAILTSHIGSLSIFLRGIVDFKKISCQIFKTRHFWIKNHF